MKCGETRLFYDLSQVSSFYNMYTPPHLPRFGKQIGKFFFINTVSVITNTRRML